MESIDFDQLSGMVLEYSFLPKTSPLEFTSEELDWVYSLSFIIRPFFEGYMHITITFSYTLNDKQAPKTSLGEVELHNAFKVKGAESPHGKLTIIYKLLEITSWQLQGLFAVGFEGAFLARFLPPDIDFTYFEEGFKKKIADEWN